MTLFNFAPTAAQNLVYQRAEFVGGKNNQFLYFAGATRTINSIIYRQPSILDLEEERKSFGSELKILEPRPIVYWGSLEERMGSF